MQCAALYAINVLPVQKDLLIVSVMELPIDRALAASLLTIRQQLEESFFDKARALPGLLCTIRQQLEDTKAVPILLDCTSTAPQLNHDGSA